MPDPTQVVRPTFPTNIPQIPGVADSGQFDKTVESILATVPKGAPVTATPYVVGSDSTPKMPYRPQFEMSDQNVRPVNDSVQERKLARQQNTFAALGNTVKSFINKHEEKKQTELTSEITTVMKAQQQINNAQSVLASDPNNAMAKAVLQRNMDVIQSKLSNDKLRTQIGKAFDVSFIDSSQNDTPEIKAGEAARKQVEAANKAGTAADTPEEKAVAEMHANGGNPPVQQQQANAATQSSQRSHGVSYVDQFLKSQPTNISPNPEYGAQLAAEQAREKQITQYVIPKLMDAYTRKTVEEIRSGNANTREQYKGFISYQNQLNKLTNDAAIADAKNATAIRTQGMRDAASFRNAMLRANVSLGVADAKGIKGTALAKKMQEQAVQSWDNMISGIDKNNTELAAQLGLTKDAEAQKFLQGNIDRNNLARTQAADERQKLLTRIYGTPEAGADNKVVTGTTKGYINVTGQSPSDNSSKPSEVGSSASDSSDDSEEEQRLISGFDIAGQ